MLLTCLIAMSAVAPPLTVGDFFPLTPGIKRSYTYHSEDRDMQQDDEIGAPVKIGGKQATPVVTHTLGQSSRVSYVVDGDTVFLVAQGDRTLKTPVPIVKLGQPTVKWSYTQNAPVSLRKGVLNFTAEAKLVGKRRILGVDREILEVKTNGNSEKGDTVVRFTQTALYAAGVGLVEMTTEGTVIKETQKSKLTLVQFSAPSQNP